MPSGRKIIDQAEYAPPRDAEQIRRHYRRNSLEWFKDIPSVEDRDQPGLILKWSDSSRQPQQYAIKIWRQTRAFNVFRNIRLLGLELFAKKILGQWRSQAEHGVPEIMKYSITGLIEDVEALVMKNTGRRVKGLHDGPCRFWEGKGRQVGFSYKQQQIQMWRATTRGPSHFLVIAHDEDTAELIFSFSKVTYDNWPENLKWLRPRTLSDARRRYVFDNSSTISVRTAAGTKILGRKVDGVHSSEISHYDNPEAFIYALSGLPRHCHLHVESTANGPQGFYYEVANEALPIESIIALYDQKRPATPEWVEIFTPFLDDPEYKLPLIDGDRQFFTDTMTDYEAQLMRLDKRFTLERLKWRRYKLDHDLKRHPTLTADQYGMQEYPATKKEMFQHSGTAVFNSDRVREMEVAAKETPCQIFFRFDGKAAPIRVREAVHANMFVWETPTPKGHYIVATDVALGLQNKDRSWITVWLRVDEYHIEQVAEWLGWIGPRWLADIMTFMCIWYNNAFLVPEINAAGQGPVDTITIDNGYSNVYIHRPRGFHGGYLADGSVRYGFLTTGPSKQMIVRDLSGAIDMKTILIRSLPLIQELYTFQYDDGRAAAASGSRDDGVISAALGNYGATGGRPPSMIDPERYQLPSLAPREPQPLDPEKQTALGRLTKDERAVWRAIVEDLRLASIKNGFDPDTGAMIDPEEQQRLLKQLEFETWNSQSSHLQSLLLPPRSL